MQRRRMGFVCRGWLACGLNSRSLWRRPRLPPSRLPPSQLQISSRVAPNCLFRVRMGKLSRWMEWMVAN